MVVWLVGAATLVFVQRAQAESPRRFVEARHGLGELSYVGEIPILVVEGTHQEIGEQIGHLAIRPAATLFDDIDAFVASLGWKAAFPLLVKTGERLVERLDEGYRVEFAAAATAGHVPRDLLAFANTVGDFLNIGGCSTLVVEPSRSVHGGAIFGRNFDWPPFGVLPEFAMVTVVRQPGKRSYAQIGYAPMLGVTSGMNDAGLCLAMLEVSAAADGSPAFDPVGVPASFAFRRVLEECSTIDEAAQLLGELKRTTMFNLAVCDKHCGAVFEATTQNFNVRRASSGLCMCTNHFRTNGLARSTECNRFARLRQYEDVDRDLSLADVAAAMHAVNQGRNTLQTMIFEPSTLTLHLAIGHGPVSAKPLQAIELGHYLSADLATE